MRIFGEGKDLTAMQMCCRGLVIFIAALILIRLSGRRSFGIKTPLDNIIVVLLGAILSRAVVGASPFVPILLVSLVIVMIHRMLSWCIANSKAFGKVIEGNKILLFENGAFNHENMKKALVCHEDLMQGVRKAALTQNMSKIDTVYMERNGEISVIKKD